ncbi:hypothetical protein SDC9_179965 [bioreactor metagenome]|uniref:Uncharacterized protein n=1 Tax=bioreactor metagenome TaxID=1076179 RepID=A0A645H1Y1_9ZZZZ
MCFISLFNLCGRYFAVFAWERKNFMTTHLYGACFVYVYMPALSTNNALIWAKDRGYNSCVCLCPSNKKMHISFGAAAKLFNYFSGFIAVFIGAVTGSLLEVGFKKQFEYFLMCAFSIVAFKSYHSNLLQYIQYNEKKQISVKNGHLLHYF